MRFVLMFILIAPAFLLQAQNLNDSLYEKNNNYTVKRNHNLIKPAAITAGYAAACFIIYRYGDEEMQEFTESNQNKIAYNSFRAIGYLGLTSSSIAITACTGISSVITKNKRLEKTTILLAGGHLINGLITHELKLTFQRHRPNSGDAYNTFDWRGGTKMNESFVSGHASDAFTTATAFAICFQNKKWVPVVAYSTASLIGL